MGIDFHLAALVRGWKAQAGRKRNDQKDCGPNENIHAASRSFGGVGICSVQSGREPVRSRNESRQPKNGNPISQQRP